MKLLEFVILVLISVTALHSKELEKGPETFTNMEDNAPTQPDASQKQQKRLVMKEIIMYLTPTQIRNLQSGLAYITSQPLTKPDGSRLNQEREYLYNVKHLNEERKELENVHHNIKPIVESLEQSSENPLHHKKLEQQLFNPDLERLNHNDQLLGQPENGLALPSQPWIPFNPIDRRPILSTNYQDILLNNHNKGEWNPILEFEQTNLKKSLNSHKDLDVLLLPEKRLHNSDIPNIPNLSNHKSIQEIELELQHMNELEKQRALAEIEAIELQNKANNKDHKPSFEHFDVPLPFLNSKHLHTKLPTQFLPPPFFYSSKSIEKLRS